MSLLGLLILAAICFGAFFWFRTDPERNAKQVLQMLARIQSWQIRKKMIAELHKAEERMGLVTIGIPTVVAIAFIGSGFYLKTEGAAQSSCDFIPILTQLPRGSWVFGQKTDFQDYHTGIDLMGSQGTPIPASASGKVVWADWWPTTPAYYHVPGKGHGNTVFVATTCNGTTWYAVYAHMTRFNVAVGDTVSQGDILGFIGTTGASTGPHLHFAITDKGPTETHSFGDWQNPDEFVAAHHGIAPAANSWFGFKPTAFTWTGWILIALALLLVFLSGEGRGIMALVRFSILPGLFFAVLVMGMELAPMWSRFQFNWHTLAGNVWQAITQPVQAAIPNPISAIPLEGSVGEGMDDIPVNFTYTVSDLAPQVIEIAREENVPPEVPFVLWLKESGGRPTNPSNGEGLCGFYSRVKRGVSYFTPGPISQSQVLAELRLCAQEFRAHAGQYGSRLSFTTTDFGVLGPIYEAYNGNADCRGNAYPSWRDHPYVMNGFDADHQHMVARDGHGGCVPLSIIGALPADIRVRNILAGN